MKIKINARFLVLPLLAVAMIFALNQCKNVGPSEWPEPDPQVLNQLKISVFDNESGSTMQAYDLKLVLPDGSSKEINAVNGAYTFDGTVEGLYVITASKDGFLAESTVIEVEKPEEESVSAVTQHSFFLNKRGSANTITPAGRTLQVESGMSIPTIIEFPQGALENDQNVTVTYLPPPAKHEELHVLGERVLLQGYHFSPSLTFPEDARPTITIPINIPSVTEGNADVWFGTYNEETGEWTKVAATLNEDRTLASFEMPHFSVWRMFTGFRLVKDAESWSPWTYVGQSEVCGEGVCGTYLFSVAPTALINQLIGSGYNLNLKVMDTRCVGPKFKWASQLYARVRLVTYKVYDYTGAYQGSIQIPTKKFQWDVLEYFCHETGIIEP
jgi:hypothetical protein